MPSGDCVEVAPPDLKVHAGHLDRIAETVTTAQQAGQVVRLDAGAYGQLCAIVPALLDGLQRTLVDGVGAAAHSVRDTAGRVRTAADRYEASDRRAEAALQRARART